MTMTDKNWLRVVYADKSVLTVSLGNQPPVRCFSPRASGWPVGAAPGLNMVEAVRSRRGLMALFHEHLGRPFYELLAESGMDIRHHPPALGTGDLPGIEAVDFISPDKVRTWRPADHGQEGT